MDRSGIFQDGEEITNGQCVISDDIDGSNDEIAKMFGQVRRKLYYQLAFFYIYYTIPGRKI